MERPHASQVSELFSRGLEVEYFALHGTSIEAVQHLAEQGRLPHSGRHPGMLFMYSAERNPPKIDKNRTLVDHAKNYAEWNAEKHYILAKLEGKVDLNSVEIHGDLTTFSDGTNFFEEDCKTLAQLCSQYPDLRANLDRWLGEVRASDRKGVVFAISRNIKDDFEIHDNDDEIYILTPEGLPIQYITGIEPCGDYEFTALDELATIKD